MFLAIDRTDVNYTFFQQITENGVFYVTKMKSDLCYKQLEGAYRAHSNGLIVLIESNVEFDDDKSHHFACKIEY